MNRPARSLATSSTICGTKRSTPARRRSPTGCRRFVRRNRVVLATVMAFICLLLAATVTSSVLAIQAKRAQVLANIQRDRRKPSGAGFGVGGGRHVPAPKKRAARSTD